MVLLITGGCGFIGSNFINYYFEKNPNVDHIVNIDAMYYCANEANVNEYIRNNKKYTLVPGNLCNSKFVKGVLDTHQITHVIHFDPLS